ncbi:MAG: LysM peptidoglycan-binding domain-containing protein [Planctomycetes bacterium]|nr:LysM peptidoglycan-binding domain-containing protein [Planctomycetota bacterium]
MTTTGRIIVVVVAAAALLTLTVLAMHYLRPPDVPPPAGPEVVETPAAAGGPGDSPAAPPPASAIAADLKSAHGPDAPPAPAGSAEAAADDGLAMAASGRVIQAQVRLSQALRAGLDGPKGKAVRETLVSLANRAQLSGARLPDDPYSKSYEVARGDSVTRIGSKFLIPLELVMKLNGLASPGINAGQSLKVLQGPVNVEIFKERHELQAWIGDVCIRIYPIAVGKGNSTPEGTFVVRNKVQNPPYQPQHKARSEHREAGAPDNPLGSRWIDIGNHYGVHGTIDPPSIGHDVSEGCIRMHNKDVEELYDLVVVGASKVIVKP